ncbi:MAG: glycine cleavage system aminomethyltransferase GcvT, partial [Firmicutes bacterium]|nr:glycine cleavage system aminomethyltransferase GcvT [Bacillota bacterium]
MLKRTPLYEVHQALGAKMVDFGGWEMPLFYTSILEEHRATREKAGLFDVSHMGEIAVKGAGARAALDKLVTCDLGALSPKKIAYTFLMNENGGVVDDLLVYALGDNEFLLAVNASNTDKDYVWLRGKLAGSPAVALQNRSAGYGQLAVQGPSAQEILQTLTNFDLGQIGFFAFDFVPLCGDDVLVSRTGYTGEDGFEIYCDSPRTEELWDALLRSGGSLLRPVGLGARDTLRLESGLPLYGHELGEGITPIEAGLKFFVKLNKDFLGKEILERQISEGAARKLVGVELIGRGIPRDGCRIERDGADVGYVTSGTYSPSFQRGLAMALLDAGAAEPGAEV